MEDEYVIRGTQWGPRPMYLIWQFGEDAQGECAQGWTTSVKSCKEFPTEAEAMEYGARVNGRLDLSYPTVAHEMEAQQ